MPADVFGTFNNPYFHFHGITRTEGRYVLLHLFLFKLLNNVAHNLISYLGKLILGAHACPSCLCCCCACSVLNSASSFACSSVRAVFSRSSGLLPCGPATAPDASDVSQHGFPTAILAVLPSPLTLQDGYSGAIQQPISKGIFRCRCFMAQYSRNEPGNGVNQRHCR